MPSDKRQAILDAALSLFSTRTFNGTPMPLLAERAGVGAGTIYRYFSSKEVLGNAVFRECSGALFGVLRQAVTSASIPRDEFRGIWRGLWEFAEKNPEAFRFLELHHHEPYLDAESRAADDQLRRFASEYVRRAQAAGAMREAEPAMLIGLVWGAFVGLTKEFAAGRVLQNKDVARRSEEAVWCLLAANTEKEIP